MLHDLPWGKYHHAGKVWGRTDETIGFHVRQAGHLQLNRLCLSDITEWSTIRLPMTIRLLLVTGPTNWRWQHHVVFQTAATSAFRCRLLKMFDHHEVVILVIPDAQQVSCVGLHWRGQNTKLNWISKHFGDIESEPGRTRNFKSVNLRNHCLAQNLLHTPLGMYPSVYCLVYLTTVFV